VDVLVGSFIVAHRSRRQGLCAPLASFVAARWRPRGRRSNPPRCGVPAPACNRRSPTRAGLRPLWL